MFLRFLVQLSVCVRFLVQLRVCVSFLVLAVGVCEVPSSG